MADNKIQLILDIVNKNFMQGIKEAEATMNSFGNSTKKVKETATQSMDSVQKKTKEAASAWTTFKGVLGAAAVVGAFKAVARAAINFGKESIEAAQIQEAAVNKIRVAMETAGDYTDEALESHKEFAAQLQKNSTIGDETTLSMLALAKSYGATNEEAQKVVAAAADMASATGQSLESAVKNLSGTLNGQIGLLGKMDDGLKNLTKQQLASGAAIDLMAEKYEGAAKGEINTFAGALQQAKNAYGDMQEVVGDLITNSTFVRSALKFMADGFVLLSGYIQEVPKHFQTLQIWTNTAALGIVEFVQKGLQALEPFESGFRTVFGSIIELFAVTGGTLIQGAIDIGGKFASIFGVELPESMTNFKDNLLVTAEEMRSGEGAIGSLIAGMDEMKTSMQESLVAQEAALVQSGKNQLKIGEENDKKVVQNAIKLKDTKTELSKQEEAERKAAIQRQMAEEEALFAWRRDAATRTAEFQKLTMLQQVETTQKGLSAMSGLMKAKNKEMFQVGQAASIANATIDTYRAANAAYAAMAGIPVVGPALGAAAAAGAIASGLAQVSEIRSQKFATGGIVQGNNMAGDLVPISVNSGEMILNKQQQSQLFSIAQGNGSGNSEGRLKAMEDKIIALMNQPVVVQIDGEVVAQAVRNQNELGFGG